MRQRIASVVQLVGIGALVFAAFRLATVAGVAAVGVALLVVGLAVER